MKNRLEGGKKGLPCASGGEGTLPLSNISFFPSAGRLRRNRLIHGRKKTPTLILIWSDGSHDICAQGMDSKEEEEEEEEEKKDGERVTNGEEKQAARYPATRTDF